VYTFSSDKEATLISRCGTSATIVLYLLEIGKEITDARKKSLNDPKEMLNILH